MLNSILIALLITFLNSVASLLIAIYGYKKNYNKFTTIVFASMVIRFFIAAFFIWFGFVILKLDKLAFGMTFILSTFIFIFIEILYLNFRSNFLILQKRKD
jgi:hypothetical protein